jgi:hypothetical protein
MKIELNGAERCELASNGGFVLVRVPVRAMGDLERAKAIVRYQVGGFLGRETVWPLGGASEGTLTFRIPRELFRDRERLTLEVLRADDPARPETLWARRYELHWTNGAPRMEPVPE